MSDHDSDNRSGRRWLRRLLTALGCLLLFLVAALAAVKWWVAPLVIRTQAESALGDYWGGEAAVGRVEFHYTAPILLGEVTLTDPNGRRWARVESVRAVLRDWPGTRPVLTAVEVGPVELTAHVAGGRCRPPLREPRAEPSDLGEYVELLRVAAEDIRIAAVDHDSGRRVARRLAFGLTRPDGSSPYGVRLTERLPSGGEATLLDGNVHGDTTEAALRVTVDQPLRKPEVAFALGLAGPAGLRELAGDVRVDLAITGRLDEPNSLRPRGELALAGFRAAGETPIVHGVDVRMDVDGSSGTLRRADANTPAGSVRIQETPFRWDAGTGTLSADVGDVLLTGRGGDPGPFWRDALGGVTADGQVRLSGKVAIRPARLDESTFDLMTHPRIRHVHFAADPNRDLRDISAGYVRLRPTRIDADRLEGRFARGRVRFTGAVFVEDGATPATIRDWGRVERLGGGGNLFMDDVDLVAVPILPGLLRVMNVLPEGRSGVSDVNADLTLAGGVVTVQKGRLANPLSALAAEKGGTVDLRKGTIDGHVVVVPLKPLHDVLSKIPLVNLTVGFKDRLSRFRVQGPWTASPGKLVKPQPLENLAEGTGEFFKGVAKAGGQLGKGVVRGLGDVLNALDLSGPKR